MVSQPNWHLKFYQTELARDIPENSSYLICGAADDAMLTIVIRTLTATGFSAETTMLDLCKTPLTYSKMTFGAKSHHIKISYIEADALFLPFRNDSFDVIVSDAILTRFKKEEKKTVISEWWRVLRQNGKIVTTARLEEKDKVYVASKEARKQFVEEGRKLSIEHGLDPTKLANLAWVYSGKMKSYPFASIDQIRKLLSGFEARIESTGKNFKEIVLRRYARIVGVKR
jgi:SAM-dependent methyltransferase